ncbi:MAG: hypothetical protein M1816_000837 [Peltula sp. TS41687]|nr:MAG: hypothetical protein M1816_000837 [Peltula sp. TS41687]
MATSSTETPSLASSSSTETPSLTSSTVPLTRTVFANSETIIISLASLPGRPNAPAAAKVSTYLLNSQGLTTRTLGLSATTVILPPGIRTRSRSSSEETSEESRSEGSDSATSLTDAGTATITAASQPSTQSIPLTNLPSLGTAPLVPTATIGTTPPAAPPSNKVTTIGAVVGVVGGIAAFFFAGFLYWLFRRYRKRKAKRATAGLLGAPQRGVEEIRAGKGNVLSPVTIEGFGRPGDNDIARTTTLPVPQRLPSGQDSQAQRRIPSREDLAPVNPIPEEWLRDIEIHAPLPRPPSRDWRRFPDFGSEMGSAYPLSVTEDYSTNIGEGSVSGGFETAFMREERLARMQRPGHSPPPSPTPRPPAPIHDVQGWVEHARVALDRVAGVSLLGHTAPREDQDATMVASPTTGEAKSSPQQDSSGLASNTPLIKNDVGPSQSAAPQQ